MDTPELNGLIDRWCSRVGAASDASNLDENGLVPLVEFKDARHYTSSSNEDLMVELLNTARQTGRFGRLAQACSSLQKAYSAIIEECRGVYMKTVEPKKFNKDEMNVWLQRSVRKYRDLQTMYVSAFIPLQGQIDGILKECETMYKALSRIVELRKNSMGPAPGMEGTPRNTARRQVRRGT